MSLISVRFTVKNPRSAGLYLLIRLNFLLFEHKWMIFQPLFGVDLTFFNLCVCRVCRSVLPPPPPPPPPRSQQAFMQSRPVPALHDAVGAVAPQLPRRPGLGPGKPSAPAWPTSSPRPPSTSPYCSSRSSTSPPAWAARSSSTRTSCRYVPSLWNFPFASLLKLWIKTRVPLTVHGLCAAINKMHVRYQYWCSR